MSSRTFTLIHQTERIRAQEAICNAPDGHVVVIKEPTRNLEQNSLLWTLLDCFAKQKQWPVNGEMVYMDAESWKDVLSAAFKKETIRMTQGIDGGIVMLGQRTSKFSKKQFAEFIEFIYATAAHFGIDTKY